MDEQQELGQAAEQAAFERSFAETAGIEPPAPAAASTDATVVDGAEPAAEQPAGQSAPQEQSAQDDDPVLLDGLKRSELRRLLGNAADVEAMKRQIDKAHGHIGELNRRLLQTPAAAPAAPAAAAPAAPAVAAPAAPAVAALSPADLQQFEADYPEVAQYVRALGITPQQRQETPPADAPSAQADAQTVQAGSDPLAIELAVMDRVHTGWREKLGSQEFSVWIASQEDAVRQAYDTAQTADAMAAVLGQFDQWTTARTVAADKVAKGQQRLQKAVTPTGNAQRPQSAPTELEAMEAAFKKTLGQ